MEWYYTVSSIKAQWGKATAAERKAIKEYALAINPTRFPNCQWAFLRYVPTVSHVDRNKTKVPKTVLACGFGLLKQPGLSTKEMYAVLGLPYKPSQFAARSHTPAQPKRKPLRRLNANAPANTSKRPVKPLRKL